MSSGPPSRTSSRAAPLQWGDSPAEWSSGCADCCEDFDICCKGCWCPCELHGDIKENVVGKRPEGGEYTCCCLIQFLFCLPIFNCTTCCLAVKTRKKMRQNYGLSKKDAFCGSDCCTHFCCHYCSQCQEAREIEFRAGALESALSRSIGGSQAGGEFGADMGGESVNGSGRGNIHVINTVTMAPPQQQGPPQQQYSQQPYYPQQQALHAPQQYPYPPQQPYPQQQYPPQQPYPQQPHPPQQFAHPLPSITSSPQPSLVIEAIEPAPTPPSEPSNPQITYL